MADSAIQIGLLVFPRMTQLDMTGPCEVLARVPGTKVHLVWKTMDPVTSDTGFKVTPTTTLAQCPRLDVICVPGGPGQVDLMDDADVVSFVRRQGLEAKYVTSVCTGALVLGAAGLLKGYKAATHWASMDNLALFGAEAANVRVCVDRNRITGGGVTAGIDFGLTLASMLADRQSAERIQLFLEYQPEPPFQAGSPESAPSELLAGIRQAMAPMLSTRREASERAAARL